MKPSYTYGATVVRIVDGDTLDVDLDYGDDLHAKRRLRLNGIDAREHGKGGGDGATAFVRDRLPVGAALVVRTYKRDKYGRQLADVTYTLNSEQRDLVTDLLARDDARAYDGGHKQEWT